MKYNLKIQDSKLIKYIPKELLTAEYLEARALANHKQSLDALNHRGGVGLIEAYCIINNLKLYNLDPNLTVESAEKFILNWIKEHESR